MAPLPVQTNCCPVIVPVFFLTLLFAAASSAWGAPPEGQDTVRTIKEDEAYGFKVEDFGFSDPMDTPPDAFEHVLINTRPVAGQLMINGAAVQNGTRIAVADLAKLSFVPRANESGSPYASFTFQVEDDGVQPRLDPNPKVFTFHVEPVNDPPVFGTFSDVYVATGSSFTSQINPAFDPDNPVLLYAATMRDGGPLPSWLTFNSTTRTFSGLPPRTAAGLYEVRVSANDGETPSLGAVLPFCFILSTPRSQPRGTSAAVTVMEDVPYVFNESDFGFQDWLDTPADNLSRVRIATLPTKGILSLDGVPMTAGSYARVTPGLPGNSWVSPTLPAAANFGAISADGQKIVYGRNGPFPTVLQRSADGGISWTPSGTAVDRNGLFCSADGSTFVATLSGGGRLEISRDSGATWTERGSAGPWSRMALSSDGSFMAALHEDGQIHVSADGGASWEARGPKAAWADVACTADGSKLFAVVPGASLMVSTDAGLSWTPLSSGRNWFRVACSADGSKIVAADRGGPLLVSSDSGNSWTIRADCRSWDSVGCSPDGQIMTATVPYRLYFSTNQGVAWKMEDSATRLAVSASTGAGRITTLLQGHLRFSEQIPAQTLTWTPPPEESGTALTSFTFQVEDDGASNNLDSNPDTLSMNVIPVNDPPVMNAVMISSPIAPEAGEQIVSLDGIQAGPGESQEITITGESSDPSRIPQPQIIYSSPGTMAQLKFTPVAGSSGRVTLSVRLQDDGGTANGGTDTRTYPIVVPLLTPFQRWALDNGLPTDPAADGGSGLRGFAFGIPPGSSPSLLTQGGLIAVRGNPVLLDSLQAGGAGIAYGLRRSARLGAEVQSSTDLLNWSRETATPQLLAQDADTDAWVVPVGPLNRDFRYFRVVILDLP